MIMVVLGQFYLTMFRAPSGFSSLSPRPFHNVVVVVVVVTDHQAMSVWRGTCARETQNYNKFHFPVVLNSDVARL